MNPEDGLLDGTDFFSGIFVSIGDVTVEPAGFVVLVVEVVVAVAVSDSARNPSSSSVLGTVTWAGHHKFPALWQMNCCPRKYSQREGMQFQQGLELMWRIMWMMLRVQLKGWKIGKWRWRMIVGVRNHQRLVLMGRIAHKIPTVMKRRLRTRGPWATTKHLRWWWEAPMEKNNNNNNNNILLLVGIVMCRLRNTTCEIFSHCRVCYIVTLVM